jgi:hypothetical protein
MSASLVSTMISQTGVQGNRVRFSRRFSVIVRGQQLSIEFRETGERLTVLVHPGMVDWDVPDTRVHRAVNTGSTLYEEVVTFFLGSPGLNPQPESRECRGGPPPRR